MTKTQIKKSLQDAARGSLVTASDVVRWSGRSRGYVDTHILSGLERIETGRGNMYLIDDIADRLARQAVKRN